jgi:hypothetical protein
MVSSCVVGEKMREKEVCLRSNRDIPIEIWNFQMVKSGTSGFHLILGYKFKFRGLSDFDRYFRGEEGSIVSDIH